MFNITKTTSLITGYWLATLTVIVISLVTELLTPWLPHTSLLLLFMAGIVFISAKTALGPAIFASALSFTVFNFFFTEPFFTLDITHRHDFATLLLFISVSLITGNLASKMRQAIADSRQALDRQHRFFSFSQKMTSAATSQEVMSRLKYAVEQTTSTPFCFIEKQQQQFICTPSTFSVPDDEILNSIWQYEREDELPHIKGQFFSLRSADKTLALIYLSKRLSESQSSALHTFSNLAALALQRTLLAEDLEKTRLISETEQLRSALLSSVSHDLRTPLSSIIGSASSLLEYHEKLSQQDQQQLLTTILDESQRLDRHIQNLLDMTRFGQGKVTLKRDWVDIKDITAGALYRLHDELDKRHVEIDIQDNMPIIWVHGLLIEQALVNILDNASRVTPVGGQIHLAARLTTDCIEIDISDNGPGIADQEKEKIFDMFYSVAHGDSQTKTGTGLGLAISKGMIAAHGGNITVLDNPSGGTIMHVTLPKHPVVYGPEK
ncbi:sensor histidine kinase [Methylophaga sulfidovorans]|uniref:histidine kinase n=1 Tax=Methylophaga sulfidovorans TaxID=45496 RepID=A0A1I3Z0X2_9GAMM|nr:DUF4118 domain-containing protein [Methylophaga sulfidovorans]SFK37742.1 two-component system, OmpR family, sensor histidine kinase KdpD [Methylophaga sulfidovorans]